MSLLLGLGSGNLVRHTSFEDERLEPLEAREDLLKVERLEVVQLLRDLFEGLEEMHERGVTERGTDQGRKEDAEKAGGRTSRFGLAA